MASRSRLAALAVGAALLLGACEADQDPGLDPGADSGPAVTSDTLPDCPRDGPDATTPDAGCIGANGTVRRP